MIFPDEKIAEVCSFGPLKAAALLELARAGDPYALAAVVVRGTYKHLIKAGSAPAAALYHTRGFYANANLTMRVTP